MSKEAIRSARELQNVLGISEKSAKKTALMYKRAGSKLKKKKIFPLVAMDTGLAMMDMAYFLKEPEKITYQRLEDYARRQEPSKKRKIFVFIVDIAFATRLMRLKKLFEQVDADMSELKAEEISETWRALSEVVSESDATNALSSKDIEKMLDEGWNGTNFVRTIRKNINETTESLKKELARSFLLGRSQKETWARIDEIMKKGGFNSRRLLRTESTFLHCKTKLITYANEGVERYRYVAILDERTSAICRELNGCVFDIEDATPGVNFPPMHPWCRSTIIRA